MFTFDKGLLFLSEQSSSPIFLEFSFCDYTVIVI